MILKPAAINIVLNEDSTKVLLIKRCDIPIWALPGGGIEDQEEPSAAAIRETIEETGVNSQIVKDALVCFPCNKLSALTHIFVSKYVSGQLTTSAESAEVAFFPLTELPAELFFLHQKWIFAALKSTSKEIIPIKEITYSWLLKMIILHPLKMIRFVKRKFFQQLH